MTKYLSELTAMLAAVNTITTGAPLAVIHKRNGGLRMVESVCGTKVRADEVVEDARKVTCAHCLDIMVETQQNREDEYRDEAIIARDMREHPEDYRDE